MNNMTSPERQRRAKSARAKRRNAQDAAFLHALAGMVVGERLAVTKRRFSKAAYLFDSPFTKQAIDAVLQQNPPLENDIAIVDWPKGNPALLAVEPNSHDLVISILDLHQIADLPAMFFQINMALKPDGLLMAVIPCEGTLDELKQSLLSSEAELSGGAAARVNHFANIRQLGDLMHKTGFKLPVADIEERTIRYGSLQGLIRDLRDMGAGNTADRASGHAPMLGKAVLPRAEEIYREKFSDADGRLRATVKLGFLSGWKEDPSQQKPLKPGSAKHKLSDFM